MSEEQQQTRSAWAALARTCAPAFSLSFLGLAAVRVWLQYSVYGMYAATDFGVTTVVTNILRVVVTVALMAVVARRGFPLRAQSALGAVSVACMTAASVAALAAQETGTAWLAWAAYALGAVGIVWGGGMWITFYLRLSCAEAFLYAFASLALSCVAGMALALVPQTVAALVAAFMPALSLATFRSAMQALDAREDVRLAAAASPEPTYDREPRRTFARLLGGLALFSMALGFARGFPFGQAIALPVPYQAVHQLGCALLCAAAVWWAVARGRSVRFSLLWDVPLALLVVGVLLLATLTPALGELGSALVTLANTFTLGVLWMAAQDFARHSSVPGWLVLGAVWVVHQLPRELGRVGVMLVGPHDGSPMLLAVCMVVLLAASMLLLVNDSVPQVRPLLADLRREARGDAAEEPAHGDGAAREGHRAAESPTPLASPAAGENADEVRLLLVAQRYQLTHRETDIARLLLRGESKAAIGEALCLSESTVRTHARNLYAKLDVHSREQLTQLVREFEG